jgi:hypothetical protein
MLIDRSKDLRRMLADGKTLNDSLRELRATGASIMDCIFAVEKIHRRGLADAKQTVHLSPAWADMKAAHDKFHNELEDMAKQTDDAGA